MNLSSARKVQVVSDALHGQDTSHISDEDLGEPWSIYRNWFTDRAEEINPTDLLHRFFQYFAARGGEEEHEHYRLLSGVIDNPLSYPPAGEMVANLPDLEWLWPDWIPVGLVTLLAAVPGTGKSYLALDLAHRIIAGDTFPNEATVERPGRVIYVDAENTPTIFKKRVGVWGDGELDDIFLMLPEDDRLVINLDDEIDRDRLWDMAWTIEPTLIIIDSYGCATLRGENNKEDVQTMLAFLNLVAKEFDTAMLIVHHLRKHSGPQTSFLPMTIDSIRGSSHIPAMARNVLGLQWIPTNESLDENGPRRLWVMKSNLTRYPEAVGVFFDPHPLDPDVALLQYGEAPEPYREPTKTDLCAEWLEDLLRDAEEPIKPADIVEWGRDEGFGRRMIYRTRERFGGLIEDTEGPGTRSPSNCWRWHETVQTDG